MIGQVIDILKLLAYAWAAAELGTLVSLYLYAYKKGTRSKVIKGLFLLLGAFTVNLVYRFLFSYTTQLTGEAHQIYRQSMIIPLALIIITARNFRKVSTEIDKVEKEIKHKIK